MIQYVMKLVHIRFQEGVSDHLENHVGVLPHHSLHTKENTNLPQIIQGSCKGYDTPQLAVNRMLAVLMLQVNTICFLEVCHPLLVGRIYVASCPSPDH